MRESSASGYRISPGWLTFLVGLLFLLVAGLAYQQSLVASGKLGGGSTSTASKPTGAQVYTCPMHPQVVQDHPGTCPICGMELVLKSGAAQGATVNVAALKGAQLSPEQEVLADVTPVHATREAKADTLDTVGEVEVPTNQIRQVTAWLDGRIVKVANVCCGTTIGKGQKVMDFYSPDLVQAQNEYLIALQASDELGHSRYASVASSSIGMLSASRDKLLRLGLLPEQIGQLEKERHARDTIPVYSAERGVILEQKAYAGQWVNKGDELFTVADLSPIWVNLSVYEKDIAKVKPGYRVTLTSPSAPGRRFRGTVSIIQPELSMETRTYKVRVVLSNADLKIRPGMLLDASVDVDYGTLTMLPRNAVLHTGNGDLVYVKASDGTWQPRSVTVSRDFGDRVAISSGVTPADTVAGSAVFLLDSEAQLKGVPRPVSGE